MLPSNFFQNWIREKNTCSMECDLDGLNLYLEEFSKVLEPNCWIFLFGDLGSGKTSFTQILLRSLGYLKSVVSPTFSIINVMQIESPTSKIKKVCHLDLYRLKSSREIQFLGLEMELNSEAICIVEWPDIVDSEGWAEFFRSTMCRQPKSLIGISIDRLADLNNRKYSFRLLSAQEYLGIPL